MRALLVTLLIGGVVGSSPLARADEGPSDPWSKFFPELLADRLPSARLAAFSADRWAGDVAPVIEYAGSRVVIACTFKTDGAEELAREVAREVRTRLGRATYLHQIRDRGREGFSVVVAVYSWDNADAIQKQVRTIEPHCLAETSEPKRLRRAVCALYPFYRNFGGHTGDF